MAGMLAFGLALLLPAAAQEFAFAQVTSLSDMERFLRSNFPLGSDGARLRAVMEGAGAKRYAHPEQAGVEKYVYDINLCDLYVWRWNISTSSAADGGLTQLYVNGDPVHGGGQPPRTVESSTQQGATQQILRGTRPRPEASKGESSLAFVMFDVNSRSSRVSEEFVVGAGPSNADPHDLGRMHAYEAERWRTIFDDERARSVVPFAGSCD
jgi:hypothetical protein